MDNIEDILKDIKDNTGVEKALNKNKNLKKDRNFFVQLLENKKIDEETLGLFGEEVKSDSAVIKKILDTWPHQDGYKHATEKIRDDEDIAYTAIAARNPNVQYISDRLKNNEKFMMNIISSMYVSNNFLQYLPEKYRSNEEFIKVLVKKDYQSFPLASEEIRSKADIVYSAMFEPNAWYAPIVVYKASGKNVRQDKDFYKKAIEKVKEFRDKKIIIEEMKELHKLALSETKDKSKEIEEKAIIYFKKIKKSFESADSWDAPKLNKEFLEYINSIFEDIKNNKKVLALAVEAETSQKTYYIKKLDNIIEMLDEKVLYDDKFLSDIMKKTEGKVFKYLPLKLRNNKEFIYNNFYSNITQENLSKELTEDKDFILTLYKKMKSQQLYLINRVSLLIGKGLLADKSFVKEAIEFDEQIYRIVSDEVKKDKVILEKALENYREALSFADESFLNDDRLIEISVKNGATGFIDKLPMKKLSDKKFVMQLLDWASGENTNIARTLIRRVPLDLKKDKDVALACVSLTGWAIEEVDDSIKYDKDILKAAFDSGCHVYKVLDINKLKSLYEQKEIKKIMGSFYKDFNWK